MDLGLRGKRALVTASTSGIAPQKSLARRRSLINGRTQERVDAAGGSQVQGGLPT